jgi:hypothetical protein
MEYTEARIEGLLITIAAARTTFPASFSCSHMYSDVSVAVFSSF